MTNFEKAFKDALVDRGIIGSDWRLQIIERRIIGNSDYANVSFASYPPRKHNPYVGSVKVNFVRGNVYWDTYTFSGERIKASYI